jgi:hypothetical protein
MQGKRGLVVPTFKCDLKKDLVPLCLALHTVGVETEIGK